MTRRRCLAALAAAVTLVAVVPSAQAAERWLQNDDFAGSASGAVAALELALGEGYAARLSARPDEYPVQLRKLQLVFVNNPLPPPGTDCALFWLRIYDDDGSGGAEPGELRYDSEVYEYAFEIAGNEQGILEIDLAGGPEPAPGFPLTLDGDFRVELRAASHECVLTMSNGKIPICYVDGSAQVGRNFLYGNPGTGMAWFDATAVGLRGDFVIRAQVAYSGVNPPVDVVTPPPQDVVTPPPVDVMTPPRDTSQPPADVPVTPPPDAGGGGPDEGSGREDAGGGSGGGDGAPAADLPPGALSVTAILPASAPNDRATDVSVLGTGFALGVEVALDADPVTVTDVGPQRISVRVPAGLAPGVKTVVVENPDGTIATLPDAFEVTGPDPGGAAAAAAASCAAGGDGAAGGAGALVLAALVAGLVVVGRRRRAGI